MPMFNSIFYTEEVLLNYVMKFQINLVTPMPRSDIRNIVYKFLNEKDLESCFRAVLSYSPNFKSEIKGRLPEWMKKILCKMVSTVISNI